MKPTDVLHCFHVCLSDLSFLSFVYKDSLLLVQEWCFLASSGAVLGRSSFRVLELECSPDTRSIITELRRGESILFAGGNDTITYIKDTALCIGKATNPFLVFVTPGFFEFYVLKLGIRILSSIIFLEILRLFQYLLKHLVIRHRRIAIFGQNQNL